MQNDPEIQLDLRTDELSAHLIKFPKLKKAKVDEEAEDDQNDDENVDDKSDEFKSYDKKDKKEFDKSENTNEEETQVDSEDEEEEEDNNNDPKILITTTDLKISFKTYKLCRELSRILPNANYFYRKNVRMSKVIPEAIKRKYSAIIVINEDHKEPSKAYLYKQSFSFYLNNGFILLDGMLLTLLPEGPTMNFKLSNVKLSDEIKNGGGFTKHKPEIILNNFNTRLGLQIGRSFAALFPHDPQYEGRHCITFHNQRDFLFFRHHRYIFKNAEKVGIQELGPRFTMKLRSLQKGTFNSKFGEYEWVQKVNYLFIRIKN